MSTASVIQSIVVATVVLWAAASAAHRLMPVASRRLRARVLAPLLQSSAPAWLRAFAQRVQPTSTAGGSCGDGCSACGGCASAAPPVVEARPLEFRPRSKA